MSEFSSKEIFKLAEAEYVKLVQDPLLKEQLEAREKFLMDQKNMEYRAIERGIKQGLEQGLEQGREEGLLQVAKNLKKDGSSVEDIVRLTGLSLKIVQDL